MSKTKSTLLAKQHKSHFQWWVGLIVVCVVAIAGILILRFSRASTTTSIADCQPNAETSEILKSTRSNAKSTQQCMTIAFLNQYSNYHKKVGNITEVQNSIANKATTSAAQSSVGTASQAIPNTPLPECNGGPITEPPQAKFPVVDGSDEATYRDTYKTIFSEKPGSKIALTTRNWLGTTGNCFYQFAQRYFPAKSYYNYAWCALFVSYAYGVNGTPMGSYPTFLTQTVNELVYLNLNRLVPRSVTTDGGYVPRAGDMVAYERNGDNFYDHVGIVVSTVEDPVTKQRFVISREGNVRLDPNNPAPFVPDGTNIVGVRSHALSDPTIIGYIRAPGNELSAQ